MTSTTSPPPSQGDGERAPGREPESEPAAVLPAGAASPAPAETPRAGSAPGDGFVPEAIRWRWAVLGFAMMAGLHALIVVVVPGRQAVAIALGLVPYLLGGAILGLLTRGRSMLEPFYGAVIPALVLPFVVELLRVEGTNPPDVAQAMARVQWIAALAPTLVYVLMALLGFWVGDRVLRWRRAAPAARPPDGKV